MHVFIAGGTGAIGVPLTRALVAAGHQVTASTRSAANAPGLQRLGARPAIVDALDADALRRAVVAARPTHVVHQLTALPKGGPKSVRDLEATNRLRVEGTSNLIAAAVAAGMPGAAPPISANEPPTMRTAPAASSAARLR
jgi:nucleoside-diphosphate-sugar epimerase